MFTKQKFISVITVSLIFAGSTHSAIANEAKRDIEWTFANSQTSLNSLQSNIVINAVNSERDRETPLNRDGGDGGIDGGANGECLWAAQCKE